MALDSKARRKGLEGLQANRNPLIAIGMETAADGSVTKNSYGVFHLSWLAQKHPDWPDLLAADAEAVRTCIQETHGAPLRSIIWAGMGGSAEDKSAYIACGLLARGPKLYVLDSTDPAKLKFILEDIAKRSRGALEEGLKATLVVGQALGMTSFEPVVNLQILARIYDKLGIDSRPNFVYMTLPGSLLDQFGASRGYRKIELQLDNGNATSGRHSSPLTRGSLLPLALAGVDLRRWIEGTFLSEDEIHTAWQLSSYLHQQASQGRDKITLLLAKSMAGLAVWTKQDFEESLGKSEQIGLKVVVGEKPKLANYRAPKDPAQDRVFLCVQVKGESHPDKEKVQLLRRAGYPVAMLTLPAGSPLSRYMQFIHYTVFGLGWLRRMNFVTQPGVELYKAITNPLYEESQQAGGVEKTAAWKAMRTTPRQVKWRGGITLYYDRLPEEMVPEGKDAATIYASLLRQAIATRGIEYCELTFFGDTRFSPRGQALRKLLDRAAESVVRSRLKMPADVYEGPAMNHSYHEMIIGHGRCFSTVLLSEKAEKVAPVAYPADYHRAQFLATQTALAQRGRCVVSLTLRDLEPATLASLDEFFGQVATALKKTAR